MRNESKYFTAIKFTGENAEIINDFSNNLVNVSELEIGDFVVCADSPTTTTKFYSIFSPTVFDKKFKEEKEEGCVFKLFC